MAAIAIQIGQFNPSITTFSAVNHAIIEGSTAQSVPMTVMIHKTAVVTIVIPAVSFGCCDIHSAIGARMLVIISFNAVIAGIRATPIVCCSLRLAASCFATAQA